jgi:hypothetical protein
MNVRETWAVIVDTQNHKQILVKRCDVGLDPSDVSVNLTPSELRDIHAGLYEMFLTSGYPDGDQTALYSTQDNDLTFDLEITDQGRYDPVPTEETTEFLLGGSGIVVGNRLAGNLSRNHVNPQHTLVIHTQDYTGNITVQSSQIPGSPASRAVTNDWSDLFTFRAEASTQAHQFTFIQSTNWIRVIHKPDTPAGAPGVTRVELRN